MGPRNERKPIGVIERLGNVMTECVTGASWRNTPTVSVVGVGPE